MKWSPEKPKVPGWYWFKPAAGWDATMVEVVLSNSYRLVIKYPILLFKQSVINTHGQWAGPIEPPEEG